MHDDLTRRTKESELIRRLNRLERRHDDLAFPEKSSDLVSPFLALPMARGVWACSVDSGGDWYDLSGLGKTLSYNGDPEFNYDGLAPYWDYDGAGDYHNRTDEADNSITGTETYVVAAVRGLTAICWCYPEETGTQEFVFSKWTVAGNRSWVIQLLAGDQFSMMFSDDGTNSDSARSSAVSMNAWYFLAGRVRPSNFVDIFVGSATGLEETNQATARASIFDGNADLVVAARHGGGFEFNGRVALVALCAAACSDAQISSAFQQTRGAFRV